MDTPAAIVRFTSIYASSREGFSQAIVKSAEVHGTGYAAALAASYERRGVERE